MGMPSAARISLFLRSWIWFILVRRQLRTTPLPAVVERLEVAPRRMGRCLPPDQLSALVARGLRLRPDSNRCLPSALVLYRLLVEQGDRPEIVIGLREDARDEIAHAWVEIDGHNIGPAPAGRRHVELARYG